MPTTLFEITRQRHQLAELIRDYCRSQKELWQQIPWLSLQANGRDGFSGPLSNRYRQGLLCLESAEVNEIYPYFVDLETGELVRNPMCLTLMADDEVLKISLKELDAAAAVQELNQECAGPDGRAGMGPGEVATWRAKQARWYGLAADQPYRRPVLTKIS